MKRPLLLALTGLIIGIFASLNSEAMLIFSLSAITLSFPILYISRYFKFTSILLPIFFIIGLLCSKNVYKEYPAFHGLIEKDIPISINGTITECSESYNTFNYKLRIDTYTIGENPYEITPYEEINLRWSCEERLYIGTKLSTKGYLFQLFKRKNPSDFDNYTYCKVRGFDFKFSDEYYDIKGLDYNLLSYFDEVKYDVTKIFDKCFSYENASILKAVILGDKSDLSLDLQESYRDIGIYHFLAISGLHISVLVGSIFFIFKRLNYYFATFVCICFLGVYCCITEFSISIIRAGIMMIIFMCSQPFNRYYDLLSSAAFTAMIILMTQPLYLLDYGFQYSFGAVFGIGFAMDIGRNYKSTVPGLVSGLGASIMTKPIAYLYTYKINLIDIFINIILIPVMSLIVILGFSTAVFYSIHNSLGKITAFITTPILNCFKWLCNIIERFPFCNFLAGIPDIKEILVLYGCIFLIYYLLKKRKIILSVSILCLSIGICINIHTEKQIPFQADFLYVGQGDCAVIRENHNAILIDTGGNYNNEVGRDVGKYTILPYLNYSGVTEIKGVFISHTNSDHIKGLLDIMGKIKIDNVYVTQNAEENYYYNKMVEMAKDNNIPITSIGTGDSIKLGNVALSILSPSINSSYNSNNKSMVLKANYKDLSLLFTGDIDSKIEKELIENSDLEANILKVAHHGSKYSNSIEFLQAVNPDFSIISVAENNLYEQPHQEALDRFNELGLKYGATDEMGMISVIETEKGWEIKGTAQT